MTLTKEELRYLFERYENTVGDVLIASTELHQFLSKYGCIINRMSAEDFQKKASGIYAEARKFGNEFSFTTVAIYTFALAKILYERISFGGKK